MKLVRIGQPGRETPGIVDSSGGIRDLSAHVREIDAAFLAGGLAGLKGIDVESLPKAPDGSRFGPPVAGVRNFIAVGLNYADHAAETGAAIPSEPILFNKAPSCIVGPNDAVMLPKGSVKLDWEVELAIVIGRGGSYIPAGDALAHVAGFCICNDVSEREYQAERGGQWMKGKSAPTFGPLGPWLVTPDEVADVQDLTMWLDVNGEKAQRGSTKTMIFDCIKIISYTSQFMALEPGDVITTGTPPGVGLGMKPPRFLKLGDVMTLGIQGLGEQTQTVVAFAA